MKIVNFSADMSQTVINLYAKVFSESEGQDAGDAIGRLVADLIRSTGKADILGFVAMLEESIVGCIFFTRLSLSSATRPSISWSTLAREPCIFQFAITRGRRIAYPGVKTAAILPEIPR